MKNFFRKLWADESGISSVEYALLLAFVSAGIIVGAEILSEAVEGEMKSTADCIVNGSASALCIGAP